MNGKAINDLHEEIIAHLAAETGIGNSESIEVDAKDIVPRMHAGFRSDELTVQTVQELTPVQHLRGLGPWLVDFQTERSSFYQAGHILELRGIRLVGAWSQAELRVGDFPG